MARRPNILILFTDQQRFDAMSCAGNPEIQTPNMDRLAASGVRFTQACTSTPVCVAARMSMVTGHRARLDGLHSDPDRLRRVRALYYGLVSQVDDGIGELLAELQRLGLEEDTIVIFTSDHGEMLGDHGLGQKNVPYEHSVRIPLIVRWPGVTEEGATCDDLVGLNDILPTLIHGLGLEYPHSEGPLPGESFLRRSGAGLASERDGFVMDYGHGVRRWVAIRTTRYKYALWASGGREELYDLQADPWEEHNLAAGEPDLATSFRERVLAWEHQHGFRKSLEDGRWVRFDEPPVPDQDPRGVIMNEGKWPDNLPRDMQGDVETYAEAFTHLISKETSLSPDKLSIAEFKAKGGDLRGTPWEDAWEKA